MSYLTYLASDHPLVPSPNPHERMLSVNQAIALGVANIPPHLLAPGFDRNRPDVILWTDRDVNINIDTRTIEDGDFDDDFALLPLSPVTDDIWTEKEYRVSLEWHGYTEGRARGVIAYIREHLKEADTLEIWRIWMGYAEKPIVRTRMIPIGQLAPEDIQALEQQELPEPLEPYELPVQYRLIVTA